MNRNGASRKIVPTLVAVLASCGTYAGAQTVVSTPAVTATQMIAVSTSPPGSRTDNAIILDVRRALRRVAELDDSAIHIRSHRGVVTLTGSVPESWQISRAGNAARSVRGVKGVSNRLMVRNKDVAAIEQRLAPLVG